MSFEHLAFARHWRLSEATVYKLGQCQALVDTLSMVPLSPEFRGNLKLVALRKGAQSSTAIEGNTLTEEEIEKIMQGGHLSESKAYQEQEVKNIIDAMNEILGQIQHLPEIVTPDLLRQYHRLVGKKLSAPFNAVPGQFAQNRRIVGGYRCPPHGPGREQVEGLVTQLCEWLQKEFKYASGKQSFMNGIVKAIVTHVYIEWIHPFDDGNGRTGRLIEFYLLLRAGVPDICAHILSNHYNKTRPEYYAYLKKCRDEKDLTSFIDYAVTGFLDGLNWRNGLWKDVFEELFEKAWRGHVNDTIAKMKWSKPVFKRRQQLLLEMPLFESFDLDAIHFVSVKFFRGHVRMSPSTVQRDIKSLINLKLLRMDSETKTISANIESLRYKYLNRRHPT